MFRLGVDVSRDYASDFGLSRSVVNWPIDFGLVDAEGVHPISRSRPSGASELAAPDGGSRPGTVDQKHKEDSPKTALLLPRALAQSAGYEGFLSAASSACSIDVYCSSLVANAFR